MITLDFETRPIEDHRPPPLPVGVALRWPDGRSEYLAWGHRDGNNCTKAHATNVLHDIFKGDEAILMHNAKFDLSVAVHHFKVPMPNWLRLHDTQFLLVLTDPYQKNISLKPSAERLLGLKPEEQDAVYDWVWANCQKEIIERAQRVGCTREQACKALIWLAPVGIVGPYAIGDVVRTHALFEKLHEQVYIDGASAAYDLERRILPWLTKLQLRGMRINKPDLERQIEILTKAQQDAAFRIFEKMNSFVDLASPSLARSLSKDGHVSGLAKTEKGNVSTSKDSLAGATFKDPELRELITYWRGVSYILSNSLGPWAATGDANRIYTDWHQTRGMDGAEANGARTLRFSAAWFMNIANERKLKYELLPDLPKIPSPRKFILPLEGYDKIICRDWSQQEFRVAAHFADGELMQAYCKNPWLDIHDKVVADLSLLGYEYPRKQVKVFDLAILYGMGIVKTATKAKVTEAEAKMIRGLIKGSVPDLMQLVVDVKHAEKTNGFVRTWKGAKLAKEASKTIYRNGEAINLDFGYKLPNHLIQRTAAEMMKEAMAVWHEDGYAETWPWALSVHDENNVYSTDADVAEGSRELDAVMRIPGGFDVPMASDLAIGPDWGSLVDMAKDDPLYLSHNAEPFKVTK